MQRVILAAAAFLTFLAGSLVLAGPAHADEVDTDIYTMSIGGNVTFGSEPIAGAEVRVQGPDTDTSVLTGDDGKWRVGVPDAGDYTVTLIVESLPEDVVITEDEKARYELDSEGNGVYTVPMQKNIPSKSANFFLGTGERITTSFLDQFLIRLVNGINFGLLLALAAIGASLIFGTTKLSNFAHGELVTVGGLLAFTFSALGVPILLAALIAVALSGALGYFLDAGLWRPMRRKGVGGVQTMIVSIGLSLTIRYVLQFFYGGDIKQLPNAQEPKIPIIGPIALSVNDMIGMGISIVVLLLVAWALLGTRIGKATRAISDNPALAAASGINVDSIVRIVWVAATALAGLAGILWAYNIPGVRWDMGTNMLLLVFAAITLGGLGTAFGALLGALVVGILVQVSTLWVPSDMSYVAPLVVMILILLVRPQGLLGRKERIG